MKLTELHIENFRSFGDEIIRFDDYTCLVGANGSGKSVVLMALNVLFQENDTTVTNVRVLSEEDFHHKQTSRPIKITATFEDLSEGAQKEFRLYYRQKKLIVFAKAEWDENTRSALVRHYGSRLVMEEFSKYFDAEKQGKRVPELKEIYKQIRDGFPELPNESTKERMTNALREYEESNPGKCVLKDETNQFYGFTRGEYHLENYIQWVYVPAVKDASTEQEESSKTALGKLLARTVRTKLDFSEELETLKKTVEEGYTGILEKQKDALRGLGLSMEQKLRDYTNMAARLELNWHYDANKSITINDPAARARIGDGDFIGEIARAGHGMQRAFLLALLHELVGNEKGEGPKLLLGFEEPELYQHPPQAQHLAEVLERLSLPANNTQVIITTHSPYFVSSKGFENVRLVRKKRNKKASEVNQITYQQLSSKLSTALGESPATESDLVARVTQIMLPSQNELFFSGIAVIVEGLEDLGYISTQLGISKQLSDFRRLGCHFIVAGGKTNLSRLAAIAIEFRIPFFVVFDADGDETKQDERLKHEKDNKCIIKLCSKEGIPFFPEKTYWGENLIVWPSNIRKIVMSDFGEEFWSKAVNKVREDYKLSVKEKNKILITHTLEHLSKNGKESPSLIKACGQILRYAEKLSV